MTTLFYAHPKGHDDDAIDAAVREIALAGTEMLGQSISVISGRDHYRENARSLGGWSAWATEVGAGTNTDGSPTVDGIVVPDGPVGRATMMIVRAAMEYGRPVFAWLGGKFIQVLAIDTEDANDWKMGWKLKLPPAHGSDAIDT